ncbi:hypothetical protein SAMN05720469_1429 [Fibrobacter intestinalis]|uniref:Uncharacterized protein n=1 Tax=Fibrobacter intestinalis TaxID=28122 RepID=A0A1M6YGY6_9BACT|nr:hypothetical protein SAMN05720469_1429 [Fibrobacter intestinalis]
MRSAWGRAPGGLRVVVVPCDVMDGMCNDGRVNDDVSKCNERKWHNTLLLKGFKFMICLGGVGLEGGVSINC